MAAVAKAIRHCQLYRADGHDHHQQPGKEMFAKKIHSNDYSQVDQDYKQFQNATR